MALASPPMADPQNLLSSLSNSAPSFLQPPSSLHLEALACVKSLLDPLAVDVADAQKHRRDENKRKRKRADVERQDEVLPLRQVYTSGLGVKQVWEQARRVLDAACLEVERDIAFRKQQTQSTTHQDGLNGFATAADNALDEELDEEDELIEDEDLEDDISDEDSLGEEDDYEEDEDMDEDVEDIEAEELGSEPEVGEPDTYAPDPNGLNDGFFSIDDFNRQTQFLEQQDALGEDDNPSDEDEIDWNADPLSMPFHEAKDTATKSKSKPEKTSDQEDDSDDEDGPTFGDADLNADDTDEDMVDGDNLDLEAGMPTLENTNEIRYADFFAPPPKQLSKTKRMRALPKTQPASHPKPQGEDDMENDMQRAIADVRRDLLDSDDEDNSDAETGSDVDNSRPSIKNMSTHEKQQAAIAAEIRRLEAANVAKRDWTLSGEARAVERPLNSLIEEDLEFERTGKPVPVITAEVSEEIEQLIKRRIIAREFDEVVRRRPDAIGSSSDTRRGRVELLDDTKPQTGLAEVYEQEHLRATDPGYIDQRSAATKKQHDEISRLWKEVSNQLDLLSNLHFKPKRVEAEIKTVEDKPTISMEDARPVGMGVNAEESMLAPQEVYRPGESKTREGDIVVRKGGASANKEEMTREEKLRRRRREKERVKKAQAQQGKSLAGGNGASVAGADGKSGKKSKTQEKADILSDLQKGNVKVIDKKGELQDIGGKKGKKGRGANQTQPASAGVLKL